MRETLDGLPIQALEYQVSGCSSTFDDSVHHSNRHPLPKQLHSQREVDVSVQLVLRHPKLKQLVCQVFTGVFHYRYVVAVFKGGVFLWKIMTLLDGRMCLKVSCCGCERWEATKEERFFQLCLIEKVLKRSEVTLRDDKLQNTGSDHEQKPNSLVIPIVVGYNSNVVLNLQLVPQYQENSPSSWLKLLSLQPVSIFIL